MSDSEKYIIKGVLSEMPSEDVAKVQVKLDTLLGSLVNEEEEGIFGLLYALYAIEKAENS